MRTMMPLVEDGHLYWGIEEAAASSLSARKGGNRAVASTGFQWAEKRTERAAIVAEISNGEHDRSLVDEQPPAMRKGIMARWAGTMRGDTHACSRCHTAKK